MIRNKHINIEADALALAQKVSRCESCVAAGKVIYRAPNGGVEAIRKCKACNATGVRPGSVEAIKSVLLKYSS